MFNLPIRFECWHHEGKNLIEATLRDMMKRYPHGDGVRAVARLLLFKDVLRELGAKKFLIPPGAPFPILFYDSEIMVTDGMPRIWASVLQTNGILLNVSIVQSMSDIKDATDIVCDRASAWAKQIQANPGTPYVVEFKDYLASLPEDEEIRWFRSTSHE
jgi:hypothetical protein